MKTPVFNKPYGMYDPIVITIPIGERTSEIIKIDAASIGGFYIKGYSGGMYFSGYYNPTGRPVNLENWDDFTSDDPNDYGLAIIQKPNTTSDADDYYTLYSLTDDLNFIPVDYTVFMIPTHIKIELVDPAQRVTHIEIFKIDVL